MAEGKKPMTMLKSEARMTRRSASGAAGSPGTPPAEVALHIVGGRAANQALAYIGLESEMPANVTFTETKVFRFTKTERTTMANNGGMWVDTTTFLQASEWIHGTEATADRTPGKRPAAKAKSEVAAPPAFKRNMDTYKQKMERKVGKWDCIYLIWDYGSNKAPPFKGAPLLFRHWEVDDDEEKGAKKHCQGHGKCCFKRFGALKNEGTNFTATEWAEYWMKWAPEYQHLKEVRPKWHSEPLDYDEKKLKLDMFEVADSASMEGGTQGSGIKADVRRPLDVVFSDDTSALQTVQAALSSDAPLPLATGPNLDGTSRVAEVSPPETRRDLTQARLLENSAPMDSGGSCDEVLQQAAEGDLLTDPNPPLQADDNGTPKGSFQTDEKAVESDGADDNATPICVVCVEEIRSGPSEPEPLVVACNAVKGKHTVHTACLKLLTDGGVKPNSLVAWSCKQFSQYGHVDDTATCIVSLSKISGAVLREKFRRDAALRADQQEERARLKAEKQEEFERQLTLARLQSGPKQADESPEGESSSNSQKKAPKVEAPVEMVEVVALRLVGYPLNPDLRTEERATKAQTFLEFMQRKGINATSAWIGQTLPGRMVPLYLILGTAKTESGEVNSEMIAGGVRLLASQGLESADDTFKVTAAPIDISRAGAATDKSSNSQGQVSTGWAPAGKEGLTPRELEEVKHFDPVRIIVKIERNSQVLSRCPEFQVRPGVRGQYVAPKECPLQAHIDITMPRFIQEVFDPSFDVDAAVAIRQEQRKRARQAEGSQTDVFRPGKTPTRTEAGQRQSTLGRSRPAPGQGSAATSTAAGRGGNPPPPSTPWV